MTDQKDYNRQLVEDFRANRGNPDSPFKNRPLLLLTATGARSGQPRTTPMMYVPDGDRLLVIASNAGAPKHPDWYYNLVAHPEVTVEVGSETYDATASVVEGEERQRVWNRIVESYPFFADHQAKVTRQIPVVALIRRES
ncbi:MAG TPA: nitroreductase family deazaflavin-dependent oxidoreductase [Ktedonobacteraceae bacterium]|nr:nitroreductase family deazaflavin-dependent oxidoreductase [Ktedonobacteraceae bacterium]